MPESILVCHRLIKFMHTLNAKYIDFPDFKLEIIMNKAYRTRSLNKYNKHYGLKLFFTVKCLLI